MISTERLQEELQLAFTTARTRTDLTLLPALERIRVAFTDVLIEQGEILDAKSLDSLCGKLQQAQRRIETEGIPAAVVKLIDGLRQDIRKRLRLEQSWEKTLNFKKNTKLTDAEIEVLNRARSAAGLSQIFRIQGKEFFTAEEMQSMQALFLELGEVAFADFLAATKADKFNFNNRAMPNLRPYLGDIESYGGNPLDDIPIALLTLPSLADLRELLFNQMRDKYFADYRKGADVVFAALEQSKRKAKDPARKQFIEELIAFFQACDSVNCGDRMRTDFGPNAPFPESHQEVSVIEIERLKQILIADGTGGGKTGSAVAGFESLRAKGKAKRALIVCPSEVVGVWEKALSDSTQGLFQQGKAPNKVVIRAGDQDRSETWRKAAEADYVIVSIPMLRQSTDDVPNEELAQRIGADYFIIDEAHNVRNPNTEKKRKSKIANRISPTDAERVFRISQCDAIRNGYLVSMTATPVFNTILDLATQLRLLNAGQDRARGSAIPEGIDFNNIQTLARSITRNHTRLVRNLLRLRMLHRTTQDCLPVGTKLEIEPPLKVALSPLARACYDAIVEDPFYTASEKLEILRSLCMRLANRGEMTGSGDTKYQTLRQKSAAYFAELEAEGEANGKILVLGSGPARGVTRDYQSNKDPNTSATDSYIAGRFRREHETKGIRTIILDGDDTDTRPLAHPVHRGEWLDADGASMTKTRRIIADCREHQGKVEFCTRTDTSGQGIDLSFMHRIINLHPYFTSSEDEQGIGRVYRRGQRRNVKVCTLITEDSIEEGIAEYAGYKRRIIEDIMQGKPLTAFEEKMLYDNARKVREGGFLAYRMLPASQKVMWILRHIKQKGKEATREFFRFDNGRFARELAQNYVQEEELSVSGNCARLLTGLLEEFMPELKELAGKNTIQVADIGCGPLIMARALKEKGGMTIWSSDIENAMLEMGKNLLHDPHAAANVHECAMDELPYPPESKQLAFNSFALHYTRHSRRTKDRKHIDENVLEGPGGERVRALCKLNEVLVDGGIAFITLPDSLFKDENKFGEFCRVLREFFGFEVIEQASGLARSVDRKDEQEFSAYIFTLRKCGPTREKDLTKLIDWKALAFSHRISKGRPKDLERKPRFVDEKPSSAQGSFHEKFSIGTKEVSHLASEAEEKEREWFDAGKSNHKKLATAAQQLVAEFGSIQKIPTERLLSISLSEVDEAAQSEKDVYFRELLERYKGRMDDVPIEDISKESPIILVRGKTKRKGSFLCLAQLESEKKIPKPRGKRYFYEKELKKKRN